MKDNIDIWYKTYGKDKKLTKNKLDELKDRGKLTNEAYELLLKKLRNEQQKKYREANKDKINERQREYRKGDIDRYNAYKRKYYEKNREKVREYQRQYREKNREKINGYVKKYRTKIANIMEIERLHSIIKEVREYIEQDIKGNYFKRYDDEVYNLCDKLLEILEKVGDSNE